MHEKIVPKRCLKVTACSLARSAGSLHSLHKRWGSAGFKAKLPSMHSIFWKVVFFVNAVSHQNRPFFNFLDRQCSLPQGQLFAQDKNKLIEGIKDFFQRSQYPHLVPVSLKMSTKWMICILSFHWYPVSCGSNDLITTSLQILAFFIHSKLKSGLFY